MPLVGLGTYLIEEGAPAIQAVHWALEAGYRAIDTASMYQNETSIGAAINSSEVDRGDIFVTSKVWNTDQGYDSTLAAFDASLGRLDTDYLDLYLVHWPSNAHMQDTWRAMEELYESGVVRAIGVCNFMAHHLDRLASFANVAPTINQFEHHPLLQQPDVVAACEERDIRVTSWGPLVRGAINDIDALVDIGNEVGATPAQVTLRWMLDRGVIVIPKSVRQQRIIDNAQLFGFELSDAHAARIAALDRNHRTGPHPDQFPGT